MSKGMKTLFFLNIFYEFINKYDSKLPLYATYTELECLSNSEELKWDNGKPAIKFLSKYKPIDRRAVIIAGHYFKSNEKLQTIKNRLARKSII